MGIMASLAALSPDDKRLIAASVSSFIQSAPAAALATALVSMLQWNLEHLAIESYPWKDYSGREVTRYKIRRLSTKDTSIIDNKNLTPLSPPVMSMAARAADAALDTSDAAFDLAQSHIKTQKESGLIGTGLKFLFGG